MERRTVIRVGVSLLFSVMAATAMAQGPGMASSASDNPTASNGQAKPTDKQLAKSVRRAIRQAGGVDMAALSVRVKGGIVTLAGSVPSSQEASKATAVAKRVPGVVDVKNQLMVQTEED